MSVHCYFGLARLKSYTKQLNKALQHAEAVCLSYIGLKRADLPACSHSGDWIMIHLLFVLAVKDQIDCLIFFLFITFRDFIIQTQKAESRLLNVHRCKLYIIQMCYIINIDCLHFIVLVIQTLLVIIPFNVYKNKKLILNLLH